MNSVTQKLLPGTMAKEEFDKGPAKVELISPSEETVFSKHVLFPFAHGEFYNLSDSISLSPSQAGGNYTVRVSFEYQQNFVGGERKVQVKAFNAPPKLNMQLEFVKKGLGASDEAHATLEVKRADGNVPKGASVASVAPETFFSSMSKLQFFII